MASEAPSSDQGSSTQQEQEGTPLGTKRRRQSGRNTKTSTEQPESSNVPSSSRSRKSLKAPNEPRGSSRDPSDAMQRSSTPPESTGSIKYTRTGRVSKAAKGQRVHTCDECGKVRRAHHRSTILLSPASAVAKAAESVQSAYVIRSAILLLGYDAQDG